MTVLELINLLEQMDETLPVLLEGDTSFRKPTGVYVLSGNVYIESEDDE